MIQSDKFYLKDTISTISLRFDYKKPQPAELMIDLETGKKRFDMLFYMNDLEYDNDDNPYGYFSLHLYTNMKNYLDATGKVLGHNDVWIPIGPCDIDGSEDWWWLSGGINYYCPKFDKNHFIHGGFASDKFSLMRLVIHICDDSEMANQERISNNKKFKKCVSREESFRYYERTIIGFETFTKEASINPDFSRYLYTSDKNKNFSMKHEDLIVDSRKDI